MDENVHLKPGKILRIKPKDSLNKLSYRLSMSLKQPDDNYVVDELFHNDNVTIYALYDVDRKLDLSPKGNINSEQVGDGMTVLEDGFVSERVESTFLLQSSSSKKARTTAKHIEGEKVDQDVQTDSESFEKKEKKEPRELKMLYCRQFKDKERKHRSNRLKTKGICTEVNGALNVNAIIKKDSYTIVKPRESLNLKVESRRNSSIYYSSGSSSNRECERIRRKDRKRLYGGKEGLDIVDESSETEPFADSFDKELVGLNKKNVRINTVPYEVPDSRESSACFSLKGFRSSIVCTNQGKELQITKTYTDETNVQNAIFEDIKNLQVQFNRLVARLEDQLISARLFLPAPRKFSNKAVNTKESEPTVRQSHQQLEPVRPKILNYDDIPVFSLIQALPPPPQKENPPPEKQELTVQVSMKKYKSSTALILKGSFDTNSEEQQTWSRTFKYKKSSSDISIQILTQCQKLKISKSDSGSIRPSIGSATSMRRSFSCDLEGSAKSKPSKEEEHVEKVMASLAPAIIYLYTQKVVIWESFSSWGSYVIYDEIIIKVVEESSFEKPIKEIIHSKPEKKTRKIPILKSNPEKRKIIEFPRPASPQKSVAQRNNSRLPWNATLHTNAELLRKNLIAKSKECSGKKEENLTSNQSIDSDCNKRSTSTFKKLSKDSTHAPQGMKVIHSNKSYLDMMKSSGKDTDPERSRTLVPHHACLKNQNKERKMIAQSIRQNIKANTNYVLYPQKVYEKVIYVRESNSRDDTSSIEFEEPVLNKGPSCAFVKTSKSEESQVISKLSKDGFKLTGKQSLPEIGNYNKEEFHVTDLSQRTSDGIQKLKKNSQVVRSIWALTKVLIFDDGSKKVEVVEASCAPTSPNTEEKSKA